MPFWKPLSAATGPPNIKVNEQPTNHQWLCQDTTLPN